MCILSNNENIIMKKAILSITIVAVCFSCNNRGTTKASESDQTIEDSVKPLRKKVILYLQMSYMV